VGAWDFWKKKVFFFWKKKIFSWKKKIFFFFLKKKIFFFWKKKIFFFWRKKKIFFIPEEEDARCAVGGCWWSHLNFPGELNRCALCVELWWVITPVALWHP